MYREHPPCEQNHLEKDQVLFVISLFFARVDYFPYIDTIILLLVFTCSIIISNMRAFFNFVARPNFAKTKRGASGGFLPRPPLLRLRHPNSEKRNQPKFCGILSPENCFRKTSSALFQITSSGLLSKKVRILSRAYRNKLGFKFPEKIWSARSADCSEFPQKSPESERVRHAERGSSLANATI